MAEYSLVLALIIIVTAAVFVMIGDAAAGLFQRVVDIASPGA